MIVGADTPHLRAAAIEAAFAALERAPAAVGPCPDGGFHLLGLAAPAPGLFEGVAWSTDRTLTDLEARAAALGLSLARLPELFDVDDGDDLARLADHLTRAPGVCPRTAALLRG